MKKEIFVIESHNALTLKSKNKKTNPGIFYNMVNHKRENPAAPKHYALQLLKKQQKIV